jgi:hypothetical protein
MTMIFNQAEGFDGDLSLLEHIKANGMLKGAGVSNYIEGLDSVKFKLSDFKSKLATDKKLSEHFYAVGRALLADSLKNSTKLGNKEGSIALEEEQVDGSEE